MKGRTFASQKKMNVGGGTGMVAKAKSAYSAHQAAKAAAPPKAAPSMPVPGKGTLIDKARRVIADRGPAKPRAQAIMAVPGMKVGGRTYGRGGKR
jgi:tRNA G37 N-methylase TrmD